MANVGKLHPTELGSKNTPATKSSQSIPLTPRDYVTFLRQVTIHAYSDVVCRRLFDSVPKQIHRILVNGISDGFVEWMLERVSDSDLKRWFAEDSSSQRKRKELESKLSQFEEAIVILKSTGSRSK